jgi:hypothetical protein
MKIKLPKKPRKKSKNELLEGVKIAFMHFDENGKMTELNDLKNINWIENDSTGESKAIS